MDFKLELTKLKNFFLGVEAEAETQKLEVMPEPAAEGEVKLGAEAKLVDGTIIRTEGDEFKVGEKLFVVSEEGIEPAPAGMHETTEGMVIVCDETGLITEVRKMEDGEVETEELEAINPLNGRVDRLEKTMTELISLLESNNNLSTQELSALKEENEKLKAEVEKAPVAKAHSFKRTAKKEADKNAEETKTETNPFKLAIQREKEKAAKRK